MNSRIEEIIHRSLSNEPLTGLDKEILDRWLSDPENKLEFDQLTGLKQRLGLSFRIDKISETQAWAKVEKRLVPSHRIGIKRIFYAAAVFIPLVTIGLFFYFTHSDKKEEIAYQHETVITTGKSKAVLTLASGETVNLNFQEKEAIVDSNHVFVAKSQGNELVYENGEQDNPDKTRKSLKVEPKEIVFNKLSVPKGGDFQLILSDGTKVWLNSASEIKYPVSFTGQKREVYLTGEAYFEVTHDAKKPFIVISEREQVQVYGTSFNVKDYRDDESVQTTLVEGSVQVTDKNTGESSFIKPGEQAVLEKDILNIRKVDVDQYVSWKNGTLICKKERLEDIMKNISRWYNVEIMFYDQEIRDYHFTVCFDKNKGIDYVVKQFNATNKVDIKLKESTLNISAKKR